MNYKTPRKTKVRTRTQIERDRQAFRGLHRRYGGIKQLLEWYNEDCKNPPRRGAPRKPSFDGHVDRMVEQVKAGGPKPTRPQIRAMVDALWIWGSWFVPLSEPVQVPRPKRETPPALWDSRELGIDREAVVDRIIKEIRKRLRASSGP